MKKTNKGSSAWFVQARQGCIDHLRALLSVKTAHDYVVAILRNWETTEIPVKAALHSASVIAYARPFTSALTKHGKVNYPTKGIKSAPGFDGELHEHILDLRHRLFAHGDYGVFPSTMYLQTVGDEKLPLRLGLNVKGIAGIETQDFAKRYEKHLSACAASIESMLNRDCTELVTQSRLHPTEFHLTHNLPEMSEEFMLGPADANLPPPTGPASRVENPAFSKGLCDYRYVTLTHEVALIESGKYMINIRGVPTEFIFSVEGRVLPTAT